jgi:hypothetical protein
MNDMRGRLLALYAIAPNVLARSNATAAGRARAHPDLRWKASMTAHVALLSISPAGADLARRTEVAAHVAAAHADAVDRQARFPAEAVATLGRSAC